MICSEILLVLVLIVLAWMVYLLMSGDKFTNSIKNKFTNKEKFTDTTIQLPQVKPGQFLPKQQEVERQRMTPVDIKPVVGPELLAFTNADNAQQVAQPVTPQVVAEPVSNIPTIKYEGFANVSGYGDMTHDAAPFKDATVEDDGKYLTVKYSGLVDGTPGEAVQIEGTDLLTAPLVDNMLYTNSIANVNRNASQDLRGDIPVQFNESYTPFYSSTIYGAPLSQHTMTIGTV
jgi:hypothetical protein